MQDRSAEATFAHGCTEQHKDRDLGGNCHGTRHLCRCRSRPRQIAVDQGLQDHTMWWRRGDPRHHARHGQAIGVLHLKAQTRLSQGCHHLRLDDTVGRCDAHSHDQALGIGEQGFDVAQGAAHIQVARRHQDGALANILGRDRIKADEGRRRRECLQFTQRKLQRGLLHSGDQVDGLALVLAQQQLAQLTTRLQIDIAIEVQVFDQDVFGSYANPRQALDIGTHETVLALPSICVRYKEQHPFFSQGRSRRCRCCGRRSKRGAHQKQYQGCRQHAPQSCDNFVSHHHCASKGR